MLREIQVFQKNDPFEIPYDYYIGNVLTPDDDLKDTYLKLFPVDFMFENQKHYFIKKEIIAKNILGLDVMTDKIYISVEMFDGDLEYQPLENIKYALYHEKYNFLNNTNINIESFDLNCDLKNYITEEYNPIVLKQISLIDSNTEFKLKTGNLTSFDSRSIGYMFIDTKTAEKMSWTKEQAELELEKAFEDYKCYVEGEIYLINVYHIYNIYEQSRKIDRNRKSNLPIITMICLGKKELNEVLEEKLNNVLPTMFQYKKEDLISNAIAL